jgi:arylsulfatase A-like enzyme
MKEIRKIEASLTPAEIGCLRALHRAEVSYADLHLGIVLDALARLGLAQRTLVALTADHGEEFKERDRVGHENTVHDELVRVPLMIGGGKLPAGLRVAGGASTILSAVGGIPQAAARSVVSRTFHDFARMTQGVARKPDDFAWIDGRLKLVLTPRDGRARLYDLAADPGEKAPLVGDPREAALRGKLDAWRSRHLLPRAPAAGKGPAVDPELERRLRGLGYLE